MIRHLIHNGREWASYREVRAFAEGNRWIIETDEMEPAVARWLKADRGAEVRIVDADPALAFRAEPASRCDRGERA